jgi:hypothetical protein
VFVITRNPEGKAYPELVMSLSNNLSKGEVEVVGIRSDVGDAPSAKEGT